MEFERVKPDTRIAIQEELKEGNELTKFQDKSPQVNNGQSIPSTVNNIPIRSSVHQPTRPLPVYAPRRTKNFVARRCDPVIRLFKWFPVLFITAVLFWGYYAYVVQLCYLTIQSVIVKIIYLLVFHVFYGMTFWSYYQTIFTEAGRVPREFWFTVTDIERLNAEVTEDARRVVCESIVRERNLPILCRTYSGGFRICEKCNLLKPDRAHHCSVCDACVLKMDHHCPWVNNCVSFTNYKFFVLFLGYAFSLCAWSAITSFEYFLRFWKNDLPSSYSKLHILFLFFVSIMFAVSLVSLYLYHLFLVFKNRSTLESFRTPIFRYGPDKRAYDLGRKKNWKQVFGSTRLTWLIPVSSCQGTGLIFHTRVSQMMGSDLPFDEKDDDHYLEGKLPLLSAGEEPSSDSEEVVFKKSELKSEDMTSVDPEDEMVTVNLSEDEPDFTEIITRDQKANSNPKDVRLLMDN